MRITAVLGVRNEARYLPITLQHLVEDGIDIAILDNESSDSSHEIYERFRRHIVYEATLPYRGHFSLKEQLEDKAKAILTVDADWVIHHDADEILESPRPGESLREALERIDAEGFEAANFDEFVFVPTRQQGDYEGTNFYHSMLDYYFYEQFPMYLMRAWKKHPGVRQTLGGHKLEAPHDLSVCPEALVLRHYVVLSQTHADTKYSDRRFDPDRKSVV